MISNLGPATEARIQAAFATACVITRKAAAEVLGVDVQTLDGMNEAAVIRFAMAEIIRLRANPDRREG